VRPTATASPKRRSVSVATRNCAACSRRRAEQQPAEHRQVEHPEHRDGRAQSRRGARAQPPPLGQRAVDRQQQPVVEPPEHEGPGGAVPEPAEQHGQDQVAVGLPLAPAVPPAECTGSRAARWTARCASAARSRRVARDVGQVEVVHQLEAHQLRDAPGDVRVAREVAEDLNGEGIGRDQRLAAAGREARRVDAVDEQRDVVGDEHLLRVAPHHQPDAVLHLLARDPARVRHLGQQVRGALDRPGHQLREEGDEECEVEEARAGLEPAAVDVDRVGERLEGVEGDADRQHDLQRDRARRDTEAGEQRGEALCEEAEVLEDEEHAEARAEADQQEAPRVGRPPADRGGAAEVDGGREQDQREEAPVPVAVEDVARDEQQPVLARTRSN
jgi:hypothetical protein